MLNLIFEMLNFQSSNFNLMDLKMLTSYIGAPGSIPMRGSRDLSRLDSGRLSFLSVIPWG
jgi:hypothetical protein